MRKIAVDWSRTRDKTDLKPAMSRFRRYLDNLGLKKNTIALYIKLANTYLAEVNSEMPSVDDAKKFYDSIHDKGLSRSAMNNFSAAMIKYHAMIDRPVKLPL
jgi:hypothetical protein